MTRTEKTVFISYRRKDVSWALAVYQNLTANGYDVFFDYTSIHGGDFERIIISNIKARAHFLVILTPSALDRCSEPGDWLRREIETAIDEKRNIIPLFFDGFDFGSPSISGKLSGKLGTLKKYNGLNIHADYFYEGMEKLCDQFLNVELKAILHPIPYEVKKAVKEQQVAANKAISYQRKSGHYETDFPPVTEAPSNFGQRIQTAVKKRKLLSFSIGGIAIVFLICLIFGGIYIFQNLPGFIGTAATETVSVVVADNTPGESVAGPSSTFTPLPTEPELAPAPVSPTEPPIPFRVAYLGQWGSEGDGDGQFRRPWGIGVIWGHGDVYVSDDFRNDIQHFSSSGEFLGRVPGNFYANHIAVDSNGLIYAANYDPGNGQNDRIEIFTPWDHQMLGSFKLKGSSLRAIDTDIYGEDIYVTDISDHKVYRYDSDGKVVDEWGSMGNGNGQFSAPWGISVDRYQTGRIYVADTGNDRIQVFTKDGTFLSMWGTKGTGIGQFDSPIDVAVDTSHGYVYVLDSNNARVQVFTPEGEFLGKWGEIGRGDGEFLDPYGIVIDADDNVYVLDSGNFRVQVFRVSFVP